MTIRVLIADDQAMVRASFRALLECNPDVHVVAEVADGSAAAIAVREHRPDVVLMDIRMPVLDGISATRQLVGEGHPARILILTTFDLDEYVYEALCAGASGFLLKDATADALFGAIHTLAPGDVLLDPRVTRRVIEAYTPSSRSAAAPVDVPQLTAREIEVLKLIARGLPNAEIARRLSSAASSRVTST
ncbi:MAG: response regulator [Solirubrobacteraceae bacterium]